MTHRPSEDASTSLGVVAEFPPSAKLVAKTLEYEGDLTQSQLAESTRLPARTVRHALSELEDSDVVASRISFMDARKKIYSLETGMDD